MAICVYYRCWPQVISGPGYFRCWGPNTILDLQTSSCDIVVTFFLHSECLPSSCHSYSHTCSSFSPSSFTPPPPHPPFPPLSPIEEELIDVAIHLDCALREFWVQHGQVDHRFFTQCIVEELVKIYLLGIARAHISSVGRC